MKQILLAAILLVIIGCDGKFEPRLTGWKAYTQPYRHRVHFFFDGREKIIELPGDDRIAYRYPQWIKSEHQLLLIQLTKTEQCFDFQIISIDTTGAIVDTVYEAPPNTPVNFKLAPNDSLILIKTYWDNCEDEDRNFIYTFYNRYSKTALPDTVTVGNTRGILLRETVWSPDSKKVIISSWVGNLVEAFAYDLATKDTTYIDTGRNFVWSPTDNHLVAYIKDYSIYGKNIETGEIDLIYEGKKKKSAGDFRWSPNGDFLMIHTRSYLLNIDAPPLRQSLIIYLSMADKRESRVFYDNQRIDTWIEAPLE